ncbi:NADH-cytochrome b5 reductase 3 [Perkinsus olseni]|uniref:NADH-cytochrome b5 reductase 3 n=1 Tax=Perkinsus olseni TaxID=32597 RepID=A0A7J6PE17_PEROL|nr:NADH-cytochrome b5 reductase 3 [Perkinsus olseni]
MITKEELEALKVAELKVKLKDAKLPISGTKAVLVGRLLEHYRALEEEKESAADEKKTSADIEEKTAGEEKETVAADDKKGADDDDKEKDDSQMGVAAEETAATPKKEKVVGVVLGECAETKTRGNEATPAASNSGSKAPSSAAGEDASSCAVEAGSSAAAMSAVDASEGTSEGSKEEEEERTRSPPKDREGGREEPFDHAEDTEMKSVEESPRSRKDEEGEDAAAVIQTKSGKAIPKITWGQSGDGGRDVGSRSPLAGEGGRSPGSRKRSLSGGEESDDRRKAERARRFGTEEGGDQEMADERGGAMIASPSKGRRGERRKDEAPPVAKAMEKFAEFVDRVMHDAQLITAEDVLAEERNAGILDLALEQFSKEEVTEMMLDVDRDIKREFRWREGIRWPPSMFHGRFRRACRMAGAAGVKEDGERVTEEKAPGVVRGQEAVVVLRGDVQLILDTMTGREFGNRARLWKGNTASELVKSDACIEPGSSDVKLTRLYFRMDRMSSPTRLRGRSFGGGVNGEEGSSGGFRSRQPWGRSERGSGAWQHDDRAGGRSFDPTSEPPSAGRRDERRGYRSRSRSPLPPMQSNLPSELKNIVDDFIRDNRLDERAASALLQRTTPDVLVRVLEMGRLTGPNHSRELMLRLRDIGGGGGGFRRSGGSPFSGGGRRRPFSPPPASRRRSRSRSEDRSRRPASPPAYRRPHRGRNYSRSGSRERPEHSSSRRHRSDESSFGGEQWTGVDSEDVNELTREYRRNTQAATDPYLGLLYPDKDPSEYENLPLAGCAMDYLPTLCANYTVERVNAEASDLDVDIARTNDEMESLAVNNYKAFISAAKVLRRVDKDMYKAREDLQGVGEGPRTVAGLLHQIRNKLYLEALELLSFADRTLRALTLAASTSRPAGPDSLHDRPVPSVVETLKEQVDAQRSHLLSSLILQLGSPQLHLPQAVPVVNHLRRYADQQKETITSQADSATGGALLNSLRAGSDLLRTYVFDTAMQYRSLFDPPKSKVGPLAVWMSAQVSWFVSLVSSFVTVPPDSAEELPFDASQLAALYRYCSHASSTLGRVDCAFMPLIEPLLDAYLQQYICGVCLDQIAMEDFNSEMQKYHWLPSTALIQGPDDYDLASVDDRASLTIYLTRHRPLAVFFNDVTAAMNELRQCPALSIADPVAKSLSHCLGEVARSLHDLAGTIASADKQELQRMTRHFVDIVVPVVASMFAKVYDFSLSSINSVSMSHDHEVQHTILVGAVTVAVVGASAFAARKWWVNSHIALKKGRSFTAKLIDKTDVSHDVRRFTFALPHENDILGLPIGHHVKLTASMPNPRTGLAPVESVSRPYTPTTLDDRKGSFQLVVKIYPSGQDESHPDGGWMSQYLDKLEPGQDSIQVTGPVGRLTYKGNGIFDIVRSECQSCNGIKNLGMVAGGTGITPHYQIIQHILQTKDPMKMSLLCANKTPDDVLLGPELAMLADTHPGQLKVHHTVDNASMNPSWSGYIGRVTKEMLRDTMPKPGPDTLILLCGPKPMNEAAKGLLKELGYDKIYY